MKNLIILVCITWSSWANAQTALDSLMSFRIDTSLVARTTHAKLPSLRYSRLKAVEQSYETRLRNLYDHAIGLCDAEGKFCGLAIPRESISAINRLLEDRITYVRSFIGTFLPPRTTKHAFAFTNASDD